MGGSSISLPKAYFVALLCEAILHGVYTVLFAGTMYLLLAPGRKRRTKRTSLANVNMTILTVIMYSLSTAHLALSMQQNLIAFFEQQAADGRLSILNDQGNPLVYCQIAIEVVNCLLSDSIVCWRTWVLWARSYKVIALPALCILGGLASGLGLVRAFVISPPGQAVYSDEIMQWFSAVAALTCVANLYAISAISYKAWRSLQALRVLKNSSTHGGGYHRTILLIFIESGAIYSVVLIGDNGVYIIADMIPHFTGIYPTGIIILVSLNLTFHDDMNRTQSKTLTSFQAAAVNTTSCVGSGSYGTVLHLRRTDGFEETGTGETQVDTIELEDVQSIESRSVTKPHSLRGVDEGRRRRLESSDETPYGSTKADELV
ncbi:hypothetical protein OH76DRAFT_1123452 [Lentinus brumalis]|uniref:Uncharacterized protein n=1 Tax=Lentinus brumalis TaxID=2498619 RepID=A0A371CUS0_9APHY|nr:hypothetical protein OH76DRAFT_1123452 [Polyporus brumalis]